MLGAISSIDPVTYARKVSSGSTTALVANITKGNTVNTASLLDISPEALSLLQSTRNAAPPSFSSPVHNLITSYYSAINLT